MSGSSRDDVSTITGSARVRSSALRRRSTSRPATLGRLRSSRITFGAIPISCHGCEPSPKKKSKASAPSRATNTWLARLRAWNARSVRAASFGSSSTSRISTSCWEFTWSSAPSRSVPPRAQALLQHSITTYAGPRERGVRALRRHAPSRCRPQPLELGLHVLLVAVRADAVAEVGGGALLDVRSEEHTSELQSRLHLVCRLLLEKKKNIIVEHID